MTKTHVVSNCATWGLTRSLSLICPDLEVTGTEIGKARAEPEVLCADVAAADTLVLLPLARTLIGDVAGPRALDGKRVIEVPGFYFSGYHPDTCYVRSSKNYPVNTRFGAYHSIICLSAFLHGLSEAETVALYNAQTYAALNYFSEWDVQRALLLDSFSKVGLDISEPFQRWSRRGCFMHTINHPHAECLFDLARVVAGKLDTRVLDYHTPSPDYLSGNAIYPCYPEIAENCGVQGYTLFKLTKLDTVVDLADFVNLSFFTYTRHGVSELNFSPEFAAKAAAAKAYLNGSATQGSAA